MQSEAGGGPGEGKSGALSAPGAGPCPGSEKSKKELPMNIQNTALVEAAARLAAAQASEDDGDSQSVSTFVRSLYKNFSPRDGDAGLTADELAAAALPLWRAAAGAKAPAGGGAHDRAADAASYRDRLGIALAASPEGRTLPPPYRHAFPSAYPHYATPPAAAPRLP